MVQEFSIIQVQNTRALPILLYGSQIWTLREKDKKRLTSKEIKFLRRTSGYNILHYKRMKIFWKS